MSSPPGGRAPSHRRRAAHGREPERRGKPWLVAVAVAVGILVVAAVAVFVTHVHHAPPAARTHTSHVTGSSASTAGSLGTTPSGAPVCPLTGKPAPGGAVPQRPALAVKVDNYPTARPQTGITKADIVFEEPVEGGITRYVAVFQCQTTGMVGPVRSARNIDIGILGQLGHPLLVHVGGINPVIANIQASPLVDIELGDYTSIIQHVAGRYAPYDTYTSTTAVWKLRPTDTTPPQPLFSYSTKPPAGTPVRTVSIPFSVYSEVDWRYDAPAHQFLRYFGTTPDVLSDGVQNSAANVIVQFVDVTYGPWLENTDGGLEVQANLYTHASGQALVFRNGVEVKGEWSRSALGQPTSFTTTGGRPISLAPGTTWVELVPSTIGVTTTPPGGG